MISIGVLDTTSTIEDVPILITRKDAKEKGLKHYFTGKPCINGHIEKRFVSNTHCPKCELERARLKRIESPEINAERCKKFREENPKYILQKNREYYLENREEALIRSREQREKDPSGYKIYQTEYRKNNGELMCFHANNRRVRLLQSSMLWADQDAILKMYLVASLLTWLTGVKHHVDHIIPLRGRTVCGLHVESNLQVLTAEENIKKSNSFSQ